MRPAVLRQTRHHDAAGVAADARRRVHANHHPAQAGMRPRPALLQQRPRPERAFDILDQFAVQFLSAKTRAAIARLDLGQELPGQRSEDSRGGKESGSTGRYRWSTYT